jgi:LmbE family N-acetylglucosaminyl deacetylase
MRVLFLGAHPDDEMACSGLLVKMARDGAVIDAITFSDCSDLIPDGFAPADLVAEWRQAMDFLGVRDRLLMSIPNRNFPAHRQAVLALLDEYRDGYDLVLCPATFDVHQDHATVAAEAVRAFKHTTLLGYELPMNEVKVTMLTGFIHLDPDIVEAKVAHTAIYRSQARRAYMHETYIRGLVAVRGVQAGCAAAEAYEVIRWHG